MYVIVLKKMNFAFHRCDRDSSGCIKDALIYTSSFFVFFLFLTASMNAQTPIDRQFNLSAENNLVFSPPLIPVFRSPFRYHLQWIISKH